MRQCICRSDINMMRGIKNAALKKTSLKKDESDEFGVHIFYVYACENCGNTFIKDAKRRWICVSAFFNSGKRFIVEK